jgi:hypothetical protein
MSDGFFGQQPPFYRRIKWYYSNQPLMKDRENTHIDPVSGVIV